MRRRQRAPVARAAKRHSGLVGRQGALCAGEGRPTGYDDGVIEHVLFESPAWLAGLCAGAGVLMYVLGRRHGWPVWVMGLWAGASVGLLAMQWAVRTDREAIRETVRKAAVAVEYGDMTLLRLMLADEFAADGRGPDEFVAAVGRALEDWDVSEARCRDFAIRVEGERARAEFRATARIEGPDFPLRWTTGRWQVDLVRTADGWRIRNVRPLRPDGRPAEWWLRSRAAPGWR